MSELRIDGDRLWANLMQMAQIGATPKGGVRRIAFSELDRQARDLFAQWAEAAGCSLRVDPFGNMFARREGSDPEAPAVLMGSHLDSQPTGGRFDGVYGVLAGLEVLQTMEDCGLRTRAPIEVVNWTNEEGYIFRPMLGSAVWAGLVPLEEALAMRHDAEGDGTGWAISDALTAMGYAGSAPMLQADRVACYIEAHIEQGPVLEAAGDWLGVVEATQGQRWYDLTLVGQEAHAGPTPMQARRDALMTMARIALEVERIAMDNAPGCGTVGRVAIHPNSPNTVPGQAMFSADLRHPQGDVLDQMDREFRDSAQAIATRAGLSLDLSERAWIPPLAFSEAIVAALEAAAHVSGRPWRRMYTGAGHDACNIARVLPTAMLFVPCRDGISHNEAEYTAPEYLGVGTQVLADAVFALAEAPAEASA